MEGDRTIRTCQRNQLSGLQANLKQELVPLSPSLITISEEIGYHEAKSRAMDLEFGFQQPTNIPLDDLTKVAEKASRDTPDDPCFFAQRRILLSRGKQICRSGCRVIQRMPEIPLTHWQKQIDAELERLMEVRMSLK